jgi:hypothetical protein
MLIFGLLCALVSRAILYHGFLEVLSYVHMFYQCLLAQREPCESCMNVTLHKCLQ